MKMITRNPVLSLIKKPLWGILLLCSFALYSNKSLACTATLNYTPGINGHYSFTSTLVGFGFGTQYWWNPGDGSGWHRGGATFNYIYKSNGRFPARLYATDSTCSDTSVVDTVVVTNVNTPCTLSAHLTYTITAHGVVNFTSTSTGTNANTQYYWAPGDSNIYYHGTTTYTHKYLYQGWYPVWLTIKDTGKSYCIDSAYTYIYVGSADSSHCHIHADFTYTVGPNGQVTFKDSSSGTQPGDQYTWDAGNSYIHSGKGPFTYTFPKDSTYSISLIVSDSSCSDSITIPITITNACGLLADFTPTYDSAGQMHFTSTSVGTNAGTYYKWTFGDGSPAVSGVGANYDTVTHAYSFLGYYDVTLFDSNSGGCTSYATKRIYIYNKDSLQACFTYVTDSLNAYELDFNASCSKGGYPYPDTYYKWNPGDSTASDSGLDMTTYSHIYKYKGPHSATLSMWYSVLPHKPQLHSTPEYDLSTFTEIVYVGSATGVAPVAGYKNYTIYPNPSNGSFTIGLNGITTGEDAQIRISNVLGQVVYDTYTTLSGNKIPVTMGAAPNGIYLLQVITATNTYTSKIIVQK